MDSNTFAKKAIVKLGLTRTEGYLLPKDLWTKKNKFGISKTQAVMLAYPEYARSRANAKWNELARTKTAQAIVPQGFQVHREIKTDGGKGEAAHVDLLPVDELIAFLKIAKRHGSKAADNLIDDLAGLSLQELFSDAFVDLQFESKDRQAYAKDNFTWHDNRDDARYSHPWFQEACKRRKYPADKVHDLMTVLLFGDTAEMARKKPLVDESLDPTIGLNHQEDKERMALLARAKRLFAGYRKGTWQEKVKRAVAEAIK